MPVPDDTKARHEISVPDEKLEQSGAKPEPSDTGHIYEFTPNGIESTFAYGLSTPIGLAFNSAGNLFVSCIGDSSIYEFTPDGKRSTFVSGLGSSPSCLAFKPVPEPSALGCWSLARVQFSCVTVASGKSFT
jgi:hypothetical protein